MKKYISTKKWKTGFSCAFRQWKADSHCKYIHGYALTIKYTFIAESLDYRNWVVDFGELKSLKSSLENVFDHKTVIAKDDHELDYFKKGHELGILDLIVIEDVGCEKFAELCHILGNHWLMEKGYYPRCKVLQVEVSEHDANSAIFFEND